MSEEIRKELEEIAPRLARLQRPEDVPPVEGNYFHNLRVDVLQNYRERLTHPKSRRESSGWWSFLSLPKRPAMAIAFASVAMLLVTVFWLWPAQVEEDAFAELKTDEIYAYIEENIDDFEVELLMQSGLTTHGSLFEDVDEDGLEDYLMDDIQQWDEDDWEDIL
ncbi:MAG: FUSC family protein [Saprospiraceae bacterium]|nr:FUSC family protein [Saprospiraceae bacterium]